MSQQDFDRQPEDQPSSSRRRFLQGFVGALGALPFVKLSAPVQRTEQAIPKAIAAKYPTPKYVPQGYQLREIYRDRSDGFNAGAGEIAYWYVHTSHPIGYNHPLAVFVVERGQQAPLVSAANREGAPVLISTLSQQRIPARYYDGFWEYVPTLTGAAGRDQVRLPNNHGFLVWSTSNVHSLVVSSGKYQIGVQGSRQVGISYDELLNIAASVA